LGHRPPIPEKAGHHAWDPFAALAFVAATTSRVVLHANLVVLPYRNPFLVAKSAATVQHLSDGRLALAVGAGYLRSEFDALGVDFEAREQLMLEGVEAMQAAWSGKPLTAQGMGWRAEGNWTLPAIRPSWLLRGGNTRSAVRHAARAFDAWAPVEATPAAAAQTSSAALHATDGLAERMAMLREEAAAAGRETPEVWLTRTVEDWLRGPRSEARSQLAHLEDLGVTWLAVWPESSEGMTLEDYQGWLELLDAVAR
jgi:probable F420-dependent oxidoreductase